MQLALAAELALIYNNTSSWIEVAGGAIKWAENEAICDVCGSRENCPKCARCSCGDY
jgi:hypothetical protein